MRYSLTVDTPVEDPGNGSAVLAEPLRVAQLRLERLLDGRHPVDVEVQRSFHALPPRIDSPGR